MTADFERCVFEANTQFMIGQGYGQPELGHGKLERVNLQGVIFKAPGDLGWIVASGEIDLRRARFEAGFDLRLSGSKIEIGRMRTAAGAHIEFCGDLELSDADVAGPALITSLRSLPGGSDPGRPARILSMQRSMVAELTVSGIDLRGCRFAGAHRLDGLRVEQSEMPETPRSWYTNARGNRIRCTRRQTILEEHLWRRERLGRGTGWDEPSDEIAHASPEANAPIPTAQQIAVTYRALRKGKEDNKDAPGGADFYYGEMEMRRLEHSHGAERLVLWLYWLVAGYGLRGSRAIIALATIVLIAAAGLDLCGFAEDRSYGRSVLFAMESSFGLLRPPAAKLTAGGQVLQLALRITGPLLVGLALLSIRGRVKR